MSLLDELWPFKSKAMHKCQVNSSLTPFAQRLSIYRWHGTHHIHRALLPWTVAT